MQKVLLMNIPPNSTVASALDTWLRDADPPGDARSPLSATADTQPASVSTDTSHDSAEALLGFRVWDGNAPAAPRLESHSLAPQPRAQEPSDTVHEWAEHIFHPLR